MSAYAALLNSLLNVEEVNWKIFLNKCKIAIIKKAERWSLRRVRRRWLNNIDSTRYVLTYIVPNKPIQYYLLHITIRNAFSKYICNKLL